MQDHIKPSLDYIEQNLKTDIKTEELANMTGYSVTHYYRLFNKAFVKMYGCSPMKYLTYYKNLTLKEMEDILMDYGMTEQQKEKIIERLGNGFYSKVLQNYELYSEKWKLSDFEFAESVMNKGK